MSRPRALVIALLVLLLGGTSGCQLFATLAYLMGPTRYQEPLYEFQAERVAIFIDGIPGRPDHPEFRRQLHAELEEVLIENEAARSVVPYEENLGVRSTNPDFYRWSIQRVGRELGAGEVIYIRIESFQLREAPGHPVLAPEVEARVKVIATDARPNQARVWPDERIGFLVKCNRQVKEARNMQVLDAEARKLGIDLARRIGRLFYKYDVEEKLPPAR